VSTDFCRSLTKPIWEECHVHASQNVEALRVKLRDHVVRNKLKSSTRRELILDTFAEIGRHVTAEELLRAVRDRDARIGAATVYRTLRVFQESGIVAERRFEGNIARFELIGDEHHDHLICTSCGTIVEFEDDVVEREQQRVAAVHGFELRTHRHELYGICAKCRSNQRASTSHTVGDPAR
jgi:Fur family transcriptional regulator, ferric uptake regulator